MDAVRQSCQPPQSFPDPPACVVRAIREGQILRSREEGFLELDRGQTIAHRRIHHELAGDGHANRPALHPHSTRYDAIETTNLFSLFLINQGRKIRVVPRIFKEEVSKVDLEFARGKGVSRKNSFVQINDFWNILRGKGPNSCCNGVSGGPTIRLC